MSLKCCSINNHLSLRAWKACGKSYGLIMEILAESIWNYYLKSINYFITEILLLYIRMVQRHTEVVGACVSNNKELGFKIDIKPRTNWSVPVSFCQFSDWQLVISFIFGCKWTLYFGWNFLLSLPILLPKIHEIRSFQSLNWQKVTVTDQCVHGLNNSSFTAEFFAVLKAIQLIENSNFRKFTIVTDSKHSTSNKRYV